MTLALQGIVPTSRSRREAALRKRVQEYSSFVKQHFGDEDADAIFTNEQHKSLNQVEEMATLISQYLIGVIDHTD